MVRIIVASLIIAWAITNTASADPSRLSAKEIADEAFTALTEPPLFPGVRVLVKRNDNTLYDRIAGWADVENAVPVAPNHRFRIYSTSKSLTAVAAMRLAERGILDLDAPASDYMKDIPDHYRPLTARQLMGHMSGIRHYRPGEWTGVSSRQCNSPSDALPDFINDPLEAKPGTQHIYTSFGYVFLSALLEAAAGMPYEDVMKREVFDPAGMSATALEGRTVEGFQLAKFYRSSSEDGTFPPASAQINSSCKFGGGGFVSSAEDLERFGRALLDRTYLTKESLEEMWTPVNEPDNERGIPAYGLGFYVNVPSLPEDSPWKIVIHDFGEPMFHGGSGEGGYSLLFLHPKTNTVSVLTANAVNGASLIPMMTISGAFGKDD